MELMSISQKLASKASIEMMLQVALFIAVLTIVGILVFQLNSDARVDLTDGSYGENATIEADKAQFKLFSNLDLLALAVIFGAIIFVILKIVPVKFDTRF